MADKSKKNVYRKTMGFNHNNTTSYIEGLKRNVKYVVSSQKDNIQQFGSNNSVIGYKERHQPNPPGQYNKFKRPPYQKEKFRGEKDGLNKAFLSSKGNSSKYNPFDFSVSRSARRKLVKGT